MKQKHYIYFVALCCLATGLLGACSNEDELDSIVVPQDNKTENMQGRFDETPFVWDYTYSTEEEADSNQIFIGDLMQAGLNEAVTTRATTNRRSYSNRTGREEGVRRSTSSTDENYRTEDIFISNPIPVYLGAVFPEKEFGKSFKPEILYPRNPIDVIFNFTRPFFGEVTKEHGSIGYKKLFTLEMNFG